MATRQQWGNALQGMGAWFAGQGPQHMNAQTLQKESEERNRIYAERNELLRKQQLAAMNQERARAMAADLYSVKLALEGNRPDLALGRLASRNQFLTSEGVDNSHTVNLTNKVAEAQRKGDFAPLIQELNWATQAAVTEGLLPKDVLGGGTDIVKGGDINASGQITVGDGRGGFKTVDVAGWQKPPEQPEATYPKVKDFRKNIQDAEKRVKDVSVNYRKVKSSAESGTAAGDMALIFAYMKMIDPGSTVREGEFATAQQTTGIPGRVVAAYNQALEGTRLNPTQRTEFVDQAKKMYEAERYEADNSINNIFQQSDMEGIPRTRIMGDRYSTWNKRWGSYGAVPKRTVVDFNDLPKRGDKR